MDPSDVAGLLVKARQGDIEALGVLLEKQRDELTRLARNELDSQVGARAAPSDVVQQTCFEAHRDFRAFRGQTEEEFVAWLRRILANNVAAAALAAAIDALPESQRRAVRLRYMEGRSLAQIAEELACTEAAAAGLLKRALRALRSRITLPP